MSAREPRPQHDITLTGQKIVQIKSKPEDEAVKRGRNDEDADERAFRGRIIKQWVGEGRELFESYLGESALGENAALTISILLSGNREEQTV